MNLYECKMENGSGFLVSAENIAEAASLAEEFPYDTSPVISVVQFGH